MGECHGGTYGFLMETAEYSVYFYFFFSVHVVFRMSLVITDFCPERSFSLKVFLLFSFVVILRTVYVLKKKGRHESLGRNKPVKVMVVAGSGWHVSILNVMYP